jgi:tRNA-modifying protein YgfZ
MMQSSWLSFLNQAGAVFEHGRVVGFGDTGAGLQVTQTGSALFDLSHRGLIRVGGADARKFLQGQFTCDVGEVDESHARLGAWCLPNGRVITLLRVFERDGALHLALPGELVEQVLTRLRLYVMRADVSLEDASGELIRVGVSGPAAAVQLSRIVESLPAVDGTVAVSQGLTVIRLGGGQPRFEIVGPCDTVSRLWLELSGDLTPAGASAWELLEIGAGEPYVGLATTELYLPQMLNLQALGGVSFTKGCYAGQEIVARTQHLGKLKRRLYRGSLDAPILPAVNDKLYRHDTGQSVGEIIAVAQHANGGWHVLAVLQIDVVRESVPVGPSGGATLALQELPYPLA